MKALLDSLLGRLGYRLTPNRQADAERWRCPRDFPRASVEICAAVQDYTMTTPERVHALVNAVEYLVRNRIDGALVECGVWKGGSTMAMALMLQRLGITDRDLYLYDTFAGMNAPTEADVTYHGRPAQQRFEETRLSDDSSDWCMATLDEVRDNVLGTGYPVERCHFIKGKVEDTIPAQLPGEIALLRLDTDWYESTRHELINLFPLVKQNGVIIIDDYGHWQGARKAVDEYIAAQDLRLLLNRIDQTARIAIKV